MIYDSAGQASILNKYFSAAFTHDDGTNPLFPTWISDDIGLSSISCSADDVYKKLVKLKPNSAAEPDNLSPLFLKQVAKEIAYPLACVFEMFFSTAFVPPAWKMAYIKPIFKNGNASDASIYRPISLICVCSKIMESIINENMLIYLLDNDLISEHQHSFLSKRSTCTQLLDSFQDWVVSLSNRKAVDVVYIDFSKAFDSVVYSKLLIKLSSYGIKYELLAWLNSFLVGRCQCVSIDGVFSELSAVVSGVPQGIVLAPLLFILYINDVVDIIDKPTTCKLFADDVKLYCDFEFSDDFTPGGNLNNHLATALLKLERWSRVWQLRVNVSKCSVLHLGLHNPLFTYTLNAKPLPMANCVRDLGVTYDNKLRFDDHIHKIVPKAFQMVNLIYRTFVSKNTDLLCRAFKTYVRPILENCSPVWSLICFMISIRLRVFKGISLADSSQDNNSYTRNVSH